MRSPWPGSCCSWRPWRTEPSSSSGRPRLSAWRPPPPCGLSPPAETPSHGSGPGWLPFPAGVQDRPGWRSLEAPVLVRVCPFPRALQGSGHRPRLGTLSSRKSRGPGEPVGRGWGAGRAEASPPACSGAPSPSRRGSSAVRPSPHGASPAAGGVGQPGPADPGPSGRDRRPPSPGLPTLPTHDSLLERDQLFFLLLACLKVAVDEGLQLHEVFVLPLLLDVLWAKRPSAPPSSPLHPARRPRAPAEQP